MLHKEQIHIHEHIDIQIQGFFLNNLQLLSDLPARDYS